MISPTIFPAPANLSTPQPMIAKVLVALDRFTDTPEVFIQALEIAEKFQAKLHIFHCVQPISMPEMGSVLAYGGMIDPAAIALQEQQFEATVEDASESLKALAHQAQERGITATSHCRIGEPNFEICAIAKAWEADLIILGRRGLSGLGEILLGSVSNYVLHHAPCSVMVVQTTQ